MSRPSIRRAFAAIVPLVAVMLVAAPRARAQSGDVPCAFVADSALDPLRTAGANGSLAANGWVAAPALQPYETTYTVDVGVWVDQKFLATTPNAAAEALRYFEHAACVFAAGRNGWISGGVNQISLHLAGDRIRYFNSPTPNLAGKSSPDGLRYHWDWTQAMAQQGGLPKVNVIFTTGGALDLDGVTGISLANGVGQGQALVAVDPNQFSNATKSNNEDWWGVIAAHEMTHAMGDGNHVAQWGWTMCCSGANYPAPGQFASKNVALSDASWSTIIANDADTSDGYTDVYATTPNPFTGINWSWPQISDFLFDRDGADVFVATSTGSSFLYRVLRHDWFCINDEVCLTGDFDGDGRDDIIAFTRGNTGDVYVSLASGTAFVGTGVKWHDWFSINSETPLVGDFNGDGKDDIATLTGGSAADVYVALSTGHSFTGSGAKWSDFFAPNTELPLVGDFNGDGRADLASFTRGTTGDAWVALSTGSGFGARVKWHDFFCINSELPVVGDWNGDGKDDVATFTRGSTGDVYVAFSTGSSFNGTGIKWHDQFALNSELPFAGDVNGDGKDDILSFARGALGRVYVAKSNGSSFVGTGIIWTTNLCLNDDVCAVGDWNGDGKADALAFDRWF